MTLAGPPLFPYEGRTRSHAKFREKFKYANALYYLIVTGRDRLREHLATALRMGEREGLNQGHPPGSPHILGMVTHVVSQTEMALVTIHSTDAQAMVDDFDQFIATHDRQCIISAHRMGLDFALDLLEELLEHSLIVLPDDLVAQINDRFINPKGLLHIWTELEVPVVATEDEATKLQRLSELRNVIEHNDERATALYCELFPEHGVGPGDRIPVGSREVGYSLAIVDHVAETLDRRALEKWPDVAIT